MARFKVAIQKPSNATYALGEGAYEPEMEYLSTIDAEIVEIEASSEGEFIEQAKECDALITRGNRITAAIIDGLENCKIIALGSVGADSVDIAAATARNIPVTNVPDTFIEEVADHTMMLMLATFRRLTLMDKMVRTGRWGEGRPYLNQFPRLFGQTLGFVSFGHVARATAIRAQPFGVRMIAFDPYIEELMMTSYGVEPVSLNELLERSDIVTMHAPSTSEVHHMLTEEHFRKMKPTALFINNGRGPTVDEEALIKALQEGWIAAAGLDVTEKEPPDEDNPLLEMENVILHSARGLRFIQNVARGAPSRGSGDFARPEWKVAQDLCQPGRLGQDRSRSVAAVLDGARARFRLSRPHCHSERSEAK